MMSDRKKRFFFAPAVAALSILLPPRLADAQQAAPPSAGAEKAREPEMAPRGQRNLVRQIKYGDWQKFCFKTPGTSMVCRTTITGIWDTGQTAVRADLVKTRRDCSFSCRSGCISRRPLN
jgi:invasion protein IalB